MRIFLETDVHLLACLRKFAYKSMHNTMRCHICFFVETIASFSRYVSRQSHNTGSNMQFFFIVRYDRHVTIQALD